MATVLEIIKILCVIVTIVSFLRELYYQAQMDSKYTPEEEKTALKIKSLQCGNWGWIALTFFWMFSSLVFAINVWEYV